MVSIYTLAALSSQRWMLVSQGGKINMQSKVGVGITLVAVWALSFAMSVPPIAGWAFYAPETSGIRYFYTISSIDHSICIKMF